MSDPPGKWVMKTGNGQFIVVHEPKREPRPQYPKIESNKLTYIEAETPRRQDYDHHPQQTPQADFYKRRLGFRDTSLPTRDV